MEQCEQHERERLRPKPRRQAARRLAAVCAGEPVDREAVWQAGCGACWIFGLPVALKDVQRDHIVPISAGGEHVRSNVRPAHPACKARRGARPA